MTVEIIETVGAWMVVDKSLPGWRLLEQHGQRHLEQLADLARLEQDGLGRQTILTAIERRCRVLQRQ